MTKSASSGDPAILERMQARAHRGRGAIYKWLHRKHSVVKKGFKKTNASWDSVVDSMIEEGVTGRGDARPNSKSVARVWVRVCEDIAQEGQVREKPRAPQNRSRPGSGWQPPVAAASRVPTRVAPFQPPVPTIRGYDPDEELPPRRPMAEPSAGSDGAPEKKMTIADLSPEGRAKIERLRQQFAETDRKRFGSF
jgi:hypothetical protein